MSKSVGIYMILNTATGDRYIGQSGDLYHRRTSHWSGLRRGSHANAHLQAAWNKYGEGAFRFDVLERCLAEVLTEREQWYFDHHHPEYNIAQVAEAAMQGRRHTPEAIEKIRVSSSCRKASLETRERQRVAQSHRSPETREKLSAALRGRAPSTETREKMRAAALARTPEQRAAYGQGVRNRTPAQKAAVAEGNRLRARRKTRP